MRNGWLRALAPFLLLIITAWFLEARSRPEEVPPRTELKDFPRVIAGRDASDVAISTEMRKVLGDGDFMERFYLTDKAAPVELFIAYFASQRTGSSMHSPKNCLPGSGWTPVVSDRYSLRLTDGRKAEINRYIIAKGDQRQVVLYWFQSHDRFIASEYSSKIHLVLDAATMHRSDGALVRIVTPVIAGEGEQMASARAAQFAEASIPQLGPFIPR